MAGYSSTPLPRKLGIKPGYRVLVDNAPPGFALDGVDPDLSIRGGEYDVALCNDGDADRLGVLDERGDFVSPHKILSLLTLYLVREKKMSGEIVKTFSTTRLIERIAKSLGAPLHETAVHMGAPPVAGLDLDDAGECAKRNLADARPLTVRRPASRPAR